MARNVFSTFEFANRLGEAKAMASQEPVFITDDGESAFVLLSIKHYRALTEPDNAIAALLAMPDTGDFELPIPHRRELPNPADLD